MRRLGFFATTAVCATVLTAFTFAQGQAPAPAPAAAGFSRSSSTRLLAIGAPAPDFALPGVDGKIHKLSEYAGAKILAVVFQCNHCPTSQLYESRIEKLYNDYKDKGLTLVAINPNNPEIRAVRRARLHGRDGLPGRDESARAVPALQVAVSL